MPPSTPPPLYVLLLTYIDHNPSLDRHSPESGKQDPPPPNHTHINTHRNNALKSSVKSLCLFTYSVCMCACTRACVCVCACVCACVRVRACVRVLYVYIPLKEGGSTELSVRLANLLVYGWIAFSICGTGEKKKRLVPFCKPRFGTQDGAKPGLRV